MTEVMNMRLKNLLKKIFIHYGILGCQSASFRGCYEAPVPNDVPRKKPTGKIKP